MSLDTAYVRRPRLLTLTVLLIFAAGLAALEALPRMEDPVLANRFSNVTTFLPGADSARIESLVTEPIEDSLSEFEEIKILESISRPGISVVTIELADEIPIDAVDEIWSRIRDELSTVGPDLPRDASVPEMEEIKIIAYTMMVALTWDLEGTPMEPALLGRLSEELADQLRDLKGTDDVVLFGEALEEILVDASPGDLAAIGLDARGVSMAIAAADAKVPAGQVRGARNDLLLDVSGELTGLDRIRSLPLLQGPDGRLVRVGDIARVHKTQRSPRATVALIDGRESVVVSARMESSMRIDRWAAEARATISAFQSNLPRGMRSRILFDQSGYTEARLGALLVNFVAGAGLVMLVLLFTMGWRSALLVGSALPLTTLMVLAGMRLLGVPIHQMSVAGLIISLGLLIDNAIIVVDEVRHRLEHDPDPVAAVGAAVRYLAVPLLGSTLTTCLAFAPIALMPGSAGEFVGSIAVSVILAVTSSLFLAMTVTPALAGMLERYAPRRGKGWLADGVTFPRFGRLYAKGLGFLFAHPVLGVAIAILLPLVGMVAATRLPEQFFPPADRDQFVVDLRLDPTASLMRTRETALRAREVLLAHERVDEVHLFVGKSAPKVYYNLLEDMDGASFYAQAVVQLDGPEDSLRMLGEVQRALDLALPDALLLAKQIEHGIV